MFAVNEINNVIGLLLIVLQVIILIAGSGAYEWLADGGGAPMNGYLMEEALMKGKLMD